MNNETLNKLTQELQKYLPADKIESFKEHLGSGSMDFGQIKSKLEELLKSSPNGIGNPEEASQKAQEILSKVGLGEWANKASAAVDGLKDKLGF